ncbi:hypothetical protein QWY85_14815 [Neolewinella lacunae]|uniref:Uncharacterized protein n=1 Tax=Neolewinella lacunae TaxID=1517758 RepID=A0A923PH05_9BACT|nr:hypothetical protein [Neolewinella lacunae]MBC6993119.1 hypothetical protein [Neolewinella lacunae]MDN3635939.1 hypothetical protein [Neolewinella lacunae]
MIKSTLTLAVVFALGVLSAQSYVEYKNHLGYENQNFRDSLEAVSRRTLGGFSDPPVDSIKVFDSSLYLHDRSKNRGVENAWVSLIQEVSSLSNYHILFGRFKSNSSREDEFRVNIIFPSAYPFSCVTSQQLQGVINRFESGALTIETESEYFAAKLQFLNEISELVDRRKFCCSSSKNEELKNSATPDSIILNISIDGCNTFLNERETLFISEAADMPEISFFLDFWSYDNLDLCYPKVDVKLVVEYSRKVSGHPTRDRNDVTVFTMDSLEFGFNYVFPRLDTVVGGRATIFVIDHFGSTLKQFEFSIKGLNPRLIAVSNFLNNRQDRPLDVFWFLNRLLISESNSGHTGITPSSAMRQFNSYDSRNENLWATWDAFSRCPNMSFDGGWGLAQPTNPRPNSPEILWSWKANIIDCIRRLQEIAQEAEAPMISRAELIIEDIQLYGKSDTIPIIDYGELRWAQTANVFYSTNPLISQVFPSNNYREMDNVASVLDAVILKRFNGASVDFLTVDIIGGRPKWKINPESATYYVHGVPTTHNYIERISSVSSSALPGTIKMFYR